MVLSRLCAVSVPCPALSCSSLLGGSRSLGSPSVLGSCTKYREVGTRHVDAVAVLVHRDPSRKAEVSNDPSRSHVYRARTPHQILFRYLEIS